MRLGLNIKIKSIKTDPATSLRMDNEDIEVIDSSCLLGSSIKSRGTRSQEIR